MKKVRFRGAQFTSRDIFDLVAVARTDPSIVETLARETRDALPRLKAAIGGRAKSRASIRDDIRPAPAFAALVGDAYDKALEIVEAALRQK